MKRWIIRSFFVGLLLLFMVVSGCSSHRPATPPVNRVPEHTNSETAEYRRTCGLLAAHGELSADRQTVEKVLGEIANRSGTKSMTVNWTALQCVGVTRSQVITIQLKDVSWNDILAAALHAADEGSDSLASMVMDDGTINVSTWEDLHSTKYLVLRIYDVGFFFEGIDSANREEAVAVLLNGVRKIALDEYERHYAGYLSLTTLRESDGKLIVNITADVQREIAEYLDQLRAKKSK